MTGPTYSDAYSQNAARLAAKRVGAGGAVEGLDPNPGMLAVARAAAPADGLREMRRVLVPGGRLLAKRPGR